MFDHPVVQRGQLHKLRNLTDRLPDALGATVAKRMRVAYRNPDALLAEILTVARLGVHPPWPAPRDPPTASSR